MEFQKDERVWLVGFALLFVGRSLSCVVIFHVCVCVCLSCDMSRSLAPQRLAKTKTNRRNAVHVSSEAATNPSLKKQKEIGRAGAQYVSTTDSRYAHDKDICKINNYKPHNLLFVLIEDVIF